MHSALEQIELNHPWVPDAVAIIRGGGAVNDPAWLNDYDLARAICELGIPVFTGIGHERDSTVLDEVANRRFDTPSKVIAGIERVILQRVREAQNAHADIQRAARQQLDRVHRNVQASYTAIETGTRSTLAQAREHSRELRAEIQWNAHHAVRHANDTVFERITDVRQFAGQHLQRAQREVPALYAEIRAEAKQSLRTARAESASQWQTVQQRASSDLQRSRDAVNQAHRDTTRLGPANTGPGPTPQPGLDAGDHRSRTGQDTATRLRLGARCPRSGRHQRSGRQCRQRNHHRIPGRAQTHRARGGRATVKHSFKESYGVLQKHAQTLREQTEPNIDDLLKIVEESVTAYKNCQARIDAVEKALEKALGTAQGTQRTEGGSADPSNPTTDPTDTDIPF